MVVYSEPPSSPVNNTASTAARDDVATATVPPKNPCDQDVYKQWLDKDPKLRSCVVVLEKIAWHTIASRLAEISAQYSSADETNVSEILSESDKQEQVKTISHDSNVDKTVVRPSNQAEPKQESGNNNDDNKTVSEDVDVPPSGNVTMSHNGAPQNATTCGIETLQMSGQNDSISENELHKHKNLSVCDIAASAERSEVGGESSEVRDEVSRSEIEVDSNQNISSDSNKRKSQSEDDTLRKAKKGDIDVKVVPSSEKTDAVPSEEISGLSREKTFTKEQLPVKISADCQSSSSPIKPEPLQSGYQVTNYKAIFKQQEESTRKVELTHTEGASGGQDNAPSGGQISSPSSGTGIPQLRQSGKDISADNPFNDVDMRHLPQAMTASLPPPQMSPGSSLPPPQMSPGTSLPPPQMSPGSSLPPPQMSPGTSHPPAQIPHQMSPGTSLPPPQIPSQMSPGSSFPSPQMPLQGSPSIQSPPSALPAYGTQRNGSGMSPHSPAVQAQRGGSTGILSPQSPVVSSQQAQRGSGNVLSPQSPAVYPAQRGSNVTSPQTTQISRRGKTKLESSAWWWFPKCDDA